MNTKITLKLDKDVIDRSKDYAKRKNTTLSVLIENYLKKITDEQNSHKKITPLVKSLSGIINLPEDYNHKEIITDYLINKYK